MKRLEKIKLILEEFENVKQTFPGIKRIDALKRSLQENTNTYSKVLFEIIQL